MNQPISEQLSLKSYFESEMEYGKIRIAISVTQGEILQDKTSWGFQIGSIYFEMPPIYLERLFLYIGKIQNFEACPISIQSLRISKGVFGIFQTRSHLSPCQTKNIYNNACLTCKNGYIDPKTGNDCISATTNSGPLSKCNVMSIEGVCSLCQMEYVLYENQCMEDCPPDTIQIDKNCISIIPFCEVYGSEGQCVMCVKGYKFSKNSCIKECEGSQAIIWN